MNTETPNSLIPTNSSPALAITRGKFEELLAQAFTQAAGRLGGNKIKREAARKQLELLQHALGKLVEAGKHEVNLATLELQKQMDTMHDIRMTEIQSVYQDWLTREGFAKKSANLLALNDFRQKTDELKKQIRDSGGDATRRRWLEKMADGLWVDMFLNLFGEAARNVMSEADPIPSGGE
jgi:hypothetical protein